MRLWDLIKFQIYVLYVNRFKPKKEHYFLKKEYFKKLYGRTLVQRTADLLTEMAKTEKGRRMLASDAENAWFIGTVPYLADSEAVLKKDKYPEEKAPDVDISKQDFS